MDIKRIEDGRARNAVHTAGRSGCLHRPLRYLTLFVGLLCAGPLLAQETGTPAGDATESSPAAEDAAPVVAAELSVEQARLADRFKRLEEVIGRLAELSASTDPRRAKLLRETIAQSREEDIHVRFESIIKLLEDERLSAAATNQTDLQKELDGLLTLLLKADRDRELSSERERVRKYLKEVSRLIRQQKDIRARTEGGDDYEALGEAQGRIADETGKLGGDIAETESEKKEDSDTENDPEKDASEGDNRDGKSDDEAQGGESADPKDGGAPEGSKQADSNPGDEPSESPPAEPKPGEQPGESPQDGKSDESQSSEGKPSDGKSSKSQQQGEQGAQGEAGGESSDSEDESTEQAQPPRDPAERASNRLREAQKNMEDARKKLDEAEREGATDKQREALQELERAKAELERILRQLREEEMERTLTQLAARFRKMLELQNQVYDGTVRLDQVPQAKRDHDDEIEAARLSRQEAQIVTEADKALLLLHEEGSSVAFPEAVEQMRGDMRQITERLGAAKVDKITQGLEQDVIEALEEIIATLEKAIKDLEKQKTPPGQSPPANQPTEPPLVHKLAELKMIRALQMRIYKRTQRYGEMIEGEEAETAELLEALAELAERQERVYRATADLEAGRND